MIGGRWLWVRVANGLGVLPKPQVAPQVILVVVPAVIMLANLIAAFPARSVAHTPPALVLRTA